MFLQFAVWTVWTLIIGGVFFVAYSEKLYGRTGTVMLNWAVGAFVVGLLLALGLMTYLANTHHIR